MAWYTDAFIFIMTWWTLLFVVLPLGVRVDNQPDITIQGKPVRSGTPKDADMKRKLILNTILSVVLWLIIRTIIVQGWISI